MSIEIQEDILKDPSKSLNLEWLDTNGLGGWASSSVIGCNTRSYHGVLVAAVVPPVDRKVMLSRLDETISINDEKISLATRDFGGTLYPQGFANLLSFKQSIYPEWVYEIGAYKIKKSLCCIQNSNNVCIKYELLSGQGQFSISFEPFVAARDYHSLQNANSNLNTEFVFSDSTLKLSPHANLPPIEIFGPWTAYNHNPCWHYRFFYQEESKRGLADREDLISFGNLECVLSKESPITLLVSCETSIGARPEDLYKEEIKRRNSILITNGKLLANKNIELDVQNLFDSLIQTSEQFLAKRDNGKTILAGYHWFTDWGRDTLIAIRGLCIATGKLELAQQILQVICNSVRDGLVPNRFVESDEQAEYNTVDASLWLFIAAYEFSLAAGNEDFTKNVLFPTLVSIYEAYSKGTHFNIHEDSDGLIVAGDEHIQLTWMDAKIGDWVVTPRHGKAVEINSLWFNALNILGIFAEYFGESNLAKKLKEKSQKTEASFKKLFWNESLGCLYDVVTDGYSDACIRPNQIFSIGLPIPIFKGEKAKAILHTVKDHLHTSRGLRTLSSKDLAYKGKYQGFPRDRDSAYHQGTVWPWLLGTYVDALFFCEPETALPQAKQIVSDFIPHLSEAGIGTISEIFDGDSPHLAKGAISQAWSVAELIRICKRIS